jgi:hypothetical protein
LALRNGSDTAHTKMQRAFTPTVARRTIKKQTMDA